MKHRRTYATLAAIVMLAIGVDVYRVGFFGDDFHMLDAVQRYSLSSLLTGVHGIWPWYRPISRELYFGIVASAPVSRLALAHTLSLVTFCGLIAFFWRIGVRLVSPPPTVIAVALLVTLDATRFVLASPSCFQDLFSLFWIMVAVDGQLAQRKWPAILGVFLAPLAKETGFLVVPILGAMDLLSSGPRPARRVWLGYAVATIAALALHGMARLSWPVTEHALRHASVEGSVEFVRRATLNNLVSAIPHGVPGAWTIVRALLAVAALMILARGAEASPPASSNRSGLRFVLAAAGLSMLPTIVGQISHLIIAQPYHLFPAFPWCALLIARALAKTPRIARTVGISALLGWNVCAAAYVPPDMTVRENWLPNPIGWQCAVRLAAEARSMGEDLRRELAGRPDSLVVLFDQLPDDSYFQTLDGPATRILLGDRTVRAYHLNHPPRVLAGDRLAILTFDLDSLHLRRAGWTEAEALSRAVTAVVGQRGELAMALVAYGTAGAPAGFDWDYCRSAAILLLDGSGPFLSSLERAGLQDTTFVRATELSRELSKDDPGLGSAMRRMLQSPTSAEAHVAIADSMLVRDLLLGAGMELRIAVTLDPARYESRYRLALVLLRMGGGIESVAELRSLAADPAAGEVAVRARELLARVTNSPSK